MSNKFAMAFDPVAYKMDTAHLTTEQHGAYLLLLMTMWVNEGSVPSDEKKLAKIVGVTLKKWHAIGDDVMAFFEIEGDKLVHHRITSDLESLAQKVKDKRLAGGKGGAAKALKNKKTGLAPATPHASARTAPVSDLFPTTVITGKKDSVNGVSHAEKPSKPHRIPDDFHPDLSFAAKAGLTPKRAESEAESFIDYWRSKPKDNTKLDWPATWRTWVRRAADRVPVPAYGNNAGHDPGGGDEFEQYARRLREEERRNASNK